MAASKELEYKGHPLRRKDNIIYFGSMADKYIIMMQILETKKVEDMEVATKVAVQLQLTTPSSRAGTGWSRRARRTAFTLQWMWRPYGLTARWPPNKAKVRLFP